MKIIPKKTMPTTEEIKAFAEAKGFEEAVCDCRDLPPRQAVDCEFCGNKGAVYVMQGVTWPPVAIEMMMAYEDKHKAIVDVLLHVAAAQTETNKLLLDALNK